MFMLEKYRPKIPLDMFYNESVYNRLLFMGSSEDIPHIIIAGPHGGGKKTLVNFYLEDLYGPEVRDTYVEKVSCGAGKKEMELVQSAYHLVIEQNSNNRDKHTIIECIKRFAETVRFTKTKTTTRFKTIVIYGMETLASYAQTPLRRTMEKYAKRCRFLMVCNNLSKIIDPLISRCVVIQVPLPPKNTVISLLSNIAYHENMDIQKDEIIEIVDKADGNIKKALWRLDSVRLCGLHKSPIDEEIDKITDHIVQIGNSINRGVSCMSEVWDIRTYVYYLLITNINGSEVLTMMMESLIKKVDDEYIRARIIELACEAEFNMVHGRREILHTDYFVIGVMKEILEKNPTIINIGIDLSKPIIHEKIVAPNPPKIRKTKGEKIIKPIKLVRPVRTRKPLNR